LLKSIGLNGMYESLDCFEEALKHFGTRVDVIIAMEMADKIDSETAYQKIKMELKELKRVRKTWKENGECGDDC
jgi:hypothetical protein